MPGIRAVLALCALTAPLVPTAQARSLAEIKASGVLRIATNRDFPPFSQELDGGLVGFAVDLGNELAARLGVRPEWTSGPTDELLNFARDTHDLVVASHAVTSTRAETVDFAQPYYCTGGVILARAGGPVRSVELAGRTVGVETGSTALAYLAKLPLKKSVKVFGDVNTAVFALNTGKVEAVVTDRFVAASAVRTYPGANLAASAPLWNEAVGMAVKKGNADLRVAVNAALAGLMQDGAYTRLSLKYFGEDIRCARR